MRDERGFIVRILAILFFFLGSAAQSQTIEERLPECIEEAEEILLKSVRIKDAIATEQRGVSPNDVMEVMFARDIIEMFSELIEQHIEADSTATELKNKYEKAVSPMGNRFDYIADMLSEHWEHGGNFAKARYIAACANNFDGKAKAQADEIVALQAENSDLLYELRNLKDKEKEVDDVLSLLDVSNSRNEELNDEIARLKSRITSETRYFETTKKRLNDEISNLLDEIERQKIRNSALQDELTSFRTKINDYLQLYEPTKWLKSVSISNTANRAASIRNSVLVRVNIVENPDEFACVNLLRTKGILGDLCAFKLSSYLSENASK